jgi:hypothetical protein
MCDANPGVRARLDRYGKIKEKTTRLSLVRHTPVYDAEFKTNLIFSIKSNTVHLSGSKELVGGAYPTF